MLYLKPLSPFSITGTFDRHHTVASVVPGGRFWGPGGGHAEMLPLCGRVLWTLCLSSGRIRDQVSQPAVCLVLCQRLPCSVRSLASRPAELGTKSLRLGSKTYCCDTIWGVLFSFLGAFLRGCLNFNWFSLIVLKFYKPWLANPLVVAGNNIAAEGTVMVKEVICPGLQCQCQTCVNLGSVWLWTL